MKFDKHIEKLCSKVSKSIGIINRIKDLVPNSVLFNLYFTLIYPYFNYCNIAWSGTHRVHLYPLIVLQKRAVRIIHRKPFLFPTNNLFFSSRLLKIPDIYAFKLGLFIYDIRDVPEFVRNHNYNSRYRNLLNPPFARLSLSQNSVYFAGIQIWNSIPQPIQNSTSISLFKRHLKSHLISNYNQS